MLILCVFVCFSVPFLPAIKSISILEIGLNPSSSKAMTILGDDLSLGEKGLIKGIGNNVLVLGIVSFLTDVSSEMIFPLLPIFVTTILGAGKEVLGFIEGIADSAASIVEIFSGYWADRTGKRKQLVVLGYGLSSLVKLGIAFSTTWWQVLIMRGVERVGKGIRTAPRDAIIASSAAKESIGKAFGLHRAMDTAGAILGPLIAFCVLSILGSGESAYRSVFFVALVPAFLAVLLIFLKVSEPKEAKPPKSKVPFWTALGQMPPKYMTFLKVSLLFSIAYFSFAFFIIRVSDLGISTSDILILYLIYNISYMLASIPVGSLSDRIGRKPVIAAAFVLYAIVCIGFAYANLWLHFVFLFVLYGIFVAADESVNKAYITDIIEEDKRGMALGAYNTAVGAAYLPASILVGFVWTMSGAMSAFLIAAGIAFTSAVIFSLFAKK